MSRLALYRKYRSADLADIVGQDHITKTLEQSLAKGQISHAYLFTGPRGTGKTSVARILARRVNNLSANEDTASVLDIIEIDAASNRGIDEIRSLREKISSSPSHLKYKVYIIDEAHMLTREAFNALLKTLEEPPPHALFILATTEAHKLPDTIISRTQRYDFRPFSEEVIIDQLAQIAKAENINVTKDGLRAIAELSEGGMRDAISILDQMSVFTEKLDANAVSARMGLASSLQIKSLLESSAQCDTHTAITILNDQISAGIEPASFNNQLQRYLRTILVNTDQTNDFDMQFVLKALDLLAKAEQQFKFTSHRSLPLEVAIIKLSMPKSTDDLASAPQSQQKPTTSAVSEKSRSSNKPLSTQDSKDSIKSSTKTDQDLTGRCTKGLSIIKEHNNSLYALLHMGNAHIEKDQIVVDCRFNFHKERIEEHRNREIIEKVMSRVCNQPITLKCRLKQQESSEPVREDSELVSSAMAILGGELVDG